MKYVQAEKKFMFGGSGKLYLVAELAKNVFIPGKNYLQSVLNQPTNGKYTYV